MFANSFQSGCISVFYSCGANPLALWDKQVKNGHIRRIVDSEVKSLVLDIGGTNVATTYITCPTKPKPSLGIKLPFLVMIVKNVKKYFSFEVQILDDKDVRRRFRISNFQSATKVGPFCTTMPICLNDGWNQIQFNLADFTKRAYGSTYIETTRLQIHANVRIRRIYFSDILYSEEDMPDSFKMFGKRKSSTSTKPAPETKVEPEKQEPLEDLVVDFEVPPLPSPEGAMPGPEVVTLSPAVDEPPLPTPETVGDAEPLEEEQIQPEESKVKLMTEEEKEETQEGPVEYGEAQPTEEQAVEETVSAEGQAPVEETAEQSEIPAEEKLTEEKVVAEPVTGNEQPPDEAVAPVTEEITQEAVPTETDEEPATTEEPPTTAGETTDDAATTTDAGETTDEPPSDAGD